tara:strand:+ start:2847 stop:3173 length:327 start_codon:yes stop_codon:yes gene_type:complete
MKEKKCAKCNDVSKKHPVEVTPEEICGMSLDELSQLRDRSMKLLEENIDQLANKKKKDDLILSDAMEIISKTCLGLHRRIEVLEKYVQELLSDKAFDELKKNDKEKLN